MDYYNSSCGRVFTGIVHAVDGHVPTQGSTPFINPNEDAYHDVITSIITRSFINNIRMHVSRQVITLRKEMDYYNPSCGRFLLLALFILRGSSTAYYERGTISS